MSGECNYLLFTIGRVRDRAENTIKETERAGGRANGATLHFLRFLFLFLLSRSNILSGKKLHESEDYGRSDRNSEWLYMMQM